MRCKSERLSAPARSLAPMVTLQETLVARALDGLDLMIDFVTLGEFGLEPAPAGMVGDEGISCDAGREALAPTPRSNAHRSTCALPQFQLKWTGGTRRLEGASLIEALR